MSQAPGDPRPPSTNGPNGKETTASSETASENSRTLPPIRTRHAGSTRSATQDVGSSRASDGTTNQTATLSEKQGQAPFKAIGMQNILNPSHRDKIGVQGNTEQSERPSSSSTNTPYMSATSLSQSPSMNSLPSITPPSSVAYPSLTHQGPRPTLAARAPSLYSVSNITRSVPSGTIDAKSSPFISSADRKTTSGPSNMTLPDVPGGLTLGYNLQNAVQQDPRSPPLRRMSEIVPPSGPTMERRMSGSGAPYPQSARSDSPTTSYSSYSRFSRTPPVPPTTVPTGQPTSYFASYNTSGPSTTFHVRDAYGSGNHGAGNHAYPSMALDTAQGTIPVPVDILAASKVADEKRRRNATASHRFRQRRKEKERETSQNIAKLEHQIRDVAEEREFYRSERDYFRSIACSGSTVSQIAPRPPSPRQVRLAQLGNTSGYGSSQWHGSDDPHGNGRNTRRRTSTYTPTTAVLPQAINPPTPAPFAPGPSLRPENPDLRPTVAPGPSPSGPPTAAPGPYGPNPPPGYHHTHWKGGHGPGNL